MNKIGDVGDSNRRFARMRMPATPTSNLIIMCVRLALTSECFAAMAALGRGEIHEGSND